MKLSIIVPIYNVEEYILDCLNSIYDDNLKDFEVICIDDRGTDKSISIVNKYIKKNNITNLVIIRHEKNQGLSVARNTGIDIAKGKYIAFVDSDDMVNSKNLNNLVDYAIKNNLDIAEGKIDEVFETNLDIKSKEKDVFRETSSILNGDDYFYLSCKESQYIPMVWCRIYKTKYLKNNYYFVPKLKFEDEEFSPRVIINSKRIQYVNIPIYIYRRRDNSITTNMMKNLDWINHYEIIIKNLKEFLFVIEDKKSYNSLNNRISNFVLSILKNPIVYRADDEKLCQIVDIIKQDKLYLIPQKSKNIFIKVQGFLMKYPKLFIKIYKFKIRRNRT